MENLTLKSLTESDENKLLERIMSNDKKFEIKGINLTQEIVKELIDTKNHALKLYSRIEIRNTIIEQIMSAFINSEYIMKQDFFDTIEEIISLFYYYKSELNTRIVDEELVNILYEEFELHCYGSITKLTDRMNTLINDDEEE